MELWNSVALHEGSKGLSVLPPVPGGFGLGVNVVVVAVRTLPLALEDGKTVKTAAWGGKGVIEDKGELDRPKILELSIVGFLNAGFFL